MPPTRLSRASGHGRAAAPVRLVHLGLGNFFRAHQAWYTEHCPGAGEWGYAAFSGVGLGIAGALSAQGGLYTLVTRAAGGDHFEVLSTVSRAHPAEDHDAWLGYFRSPLLAAVTVTVTEAGYLRRADGSLDVGRADVEADIDALRRDGSAPVRTAPGRLVAGLAARRDADAGPIALVPCDNVPGNGAMALRSVLDLAGLVDPRLADWVGDSLGIVTTAVDRITPRATDDDVLAVLRGTAVHDAVPVVTEPFREWVLEGAFPAGRPQWEQAGATFTQDVAPYERRKLWLLNGAHSILAYAGSILGHETVAAAIADDTCQGWVRQWWSEACPHLNQPAGELATYRDSLLERFSNPRMQDRLARIAHDGSQKLPIRILPVLRAERAAGRLPAGATRALAAWVCHLRGQGAPVQDARAAEVVPLADGPLASAVPKLLAALDPAVGADPDVVAIVTGQSEQLARLAPGAD